MSSDEPTWTHRGVTIKLISSNGQFSAEMPGRKLRAPSLDAMKKKIDENMTFEPFDAFTEENGYSSVRKDEKIAAEHKSPGKHYHPRLVRRHIVAYDRANERFVDDAGQVYREVIRSEPGIIEAWREMMEAEDRKAERIAQLDAEIDVHKNKLREKTIWAKGWAK